MFCLNCELPIRSKRKYDESQDLKQLANNLTNEKELEINWC